MNFGVFTTGLTAGLSLIVAIGAQNAFVIRQGLRREHVLVVCLICALSDTILITLGVTGFRRVVADFPVLNQVLRYAGALFLFWYGAKNLRAALSSSTTLAVSEGPPVELRQSVGTCLALTWLNPHAYLDTLVLLGGIAAGFPGFETSFAAGASTASFLFFFALGYGAAHLRPVFDNRTAWRVLEVLIAATMWTIAWRLLHGA